MSTFKNISVCYEHQIKSLVFNHTILFQYLKALRTISEHCYLSAGVIRQLVWSELHHDQYKIEGSEIDVIFYDPASDQEYEKHIQQALHRQFPYNDWDVVNQATVHQWYLKENGEQIAAYCSLSDAISVWPETATAIAIRLRQNDQLEIIAPLGLTDLFELKLRWNPRLVSHDLFLNRVRQKRWLERWPKLQLVEYEK
ncbi:nucleotidyltransferase family protein [Acinetobacter ihumii]|uniref:nucleotidyltransferase family protein n=1 Tax=Acinetobacter ihumii TaxID=2483802 RepID=UPI001D184B21|nr:nucleotidyltransferase family protein [Acinetobacter ihumii]